MKAKLVLIGIMLFSLSGMAQSTVVSKYFDKFSGNEDFTKVTVNSKMFSLFTELDAETTDEKDFLEAVSKIDGLKIIAADSVENAKELFAQVCIDISKDGYEELMTVEDGDEDMKFSIKEKNGKIEELIMVVGGKKSFVLLSLYGEIDLKNVSKIAKTMKINGLENLNKIKNSGKE